MDNTAEKGVGITYAQAAGILGVPAYMVKRLITSKVLVQKTHGGSGRGVRYSVPLNDVMDLKGKIAAGTFTLASLRTRNGGWKTVNNALKVIEAKLDTLIAASNNGHTNL